MDSSFTDSLFEIATLLLILHSSISSIYSLHLSHGRVILSSLKPTVMIHLILVSFAAIIVEIALYSAQVFVIVSSSVLVSLIPLYTRSFSVKITHTNLSLYNSALFALALYLFIILTAVLYNSCKFIITQRPFILLFKNNKLPYREQGSYLF